MSEQFADMGRVNLCYETFGDPGDPALLLVMGLGTQMVAWRDDFCRGLTERGFFVIRFDNRDCGRSTHMEGPTANLRDLLTPTPRNLPYTLGHMADHPFGPLDHLATERAPVA